MYQLLSIPFSHYVEKVRWGLDYFSQEFRESAYMPLLHFPALYWATRNASDAHHDSVSSRYSTPVLISQDGTRICDSARILRYLDNTHQGQRESLYLPKAEEMEDELHTSLGPHTRRLAYYFFLDNTALMSKMAKNNVGITQQWVFRASLPLGRVVMKKRFRINDTGAEKSRAKILTCFDRYNDILSDDRPYLCGDRFSIADLSFACMAAPSLLISRSDGYGAYMPESVDCPAEARTFAVQLRDSPAGQHALKMFREHRLS